MKTKLFFSTLLISTLLFTSCEKNEILSPITIEESTTIKSLNTLENTTWEVIEFKCSPKQIDLRWNLNAPQITFSEDVIKTTFNGSSCDKLYFQRNGVLDVKGGNCNILADINVEQMLDLFQGEFTWTALTNGNIEIRNNNRTKLVLKTQSQITTTTVPNLSL
jgi:hypothetical protein